MTDTTKRQQSENAVKILMQLDEKSLLLIDIGAKLLMDRQQMDKDKKKELEEVYFSVFD